MTVEDRIREAVRETRSAFSGRRHAPITRIANRAAFQGFIAVASGIVVVFATIGLAGWFAFGGSGGVANGPDAPLTTAATQPATTDPTAETSPPATTPGPETADDGLSDMSAIPEGWRNDFPEGGQFLLLDSGIAFAAFPDSEGGWWISIAQDPDFDGRHMFGPEDQSADLAGIPEALVLVAFAGDRSDVVVAGIAPLDAATVQIEFGNTSVTFDRVFPREGVDRSMFVGSIPVDQLTGRAPPLTVEMRASDAAGQEVSTPDIGYQSSSVDDQYNGPLTSDLFRIVPPLIIDSTTAKTLPDVMACEGGPGVESVPPNQGREIADGEVLPTPKAALEAILAGELAHSRYPHGGYVEITLPNNRMAYAIPSETSEAAVVLIEVSQAGNGWTVTSWEASGC